MEDQAPEETVGTTGEGQPEAAAKEPSIKLQVVIGQLADGIEVEAEGGEPGDKHYTLFESDPANPELLEWLRKDAGLGRTNGDNLNEILAHLLPSKLMERLGTVATPIVRIMDGDGRV